MRGDSVTSGIVFPKITALVEEPPALLPEQIQRFTTKSLRAKRVRSFDARRSLESLRGQHGKTVLALDIGGDKISASYFTVDEGTLRPSGNILTRQGDDGAGYLDSIRELRDLARIRELPVGISFAGPTSGTRIVAAPNLRTFMREFQDLYGGDFACLFQNVELANDAEAGIMAGSLEAVVRYPEAHDVIYVINGSGLGGAVLARNMIYAAEPGHIAIVDQLNSISGFSQGRQCGLDGATHVCVEAVAASKAGLEDMWCQATGDRLTGREIAALYAAGNDLARALYRNSAWITAHVVVGMASAFGLLADDFQPVVVAHGGIFQAPDYCERVQATLSRNLRVPPVTLFTNDFSGNTCLEGAAIAAAIKDT
jgi:predicted NBD/HSP70 family sugar kinase